MKTKIPLIEVESVKIIGKLKDTKKKIELTMNRNQFLKWREKLKWEN